jgi:hypothetical protein
MGSQGAARHLSKLSQSLNTRGKAFLLRVHSQWVKQSLRVEFSTSARDLVGTGF